MTNHINSVALTGNLTRDPELRHTSNGTAVATLGLAVNSREKKGDDWVDRADFFDVTIWGRRAESCAEYLRKGSPVAVTGRLRQETWETDGNKRSKVLISAREVQFLPSGTKGSDDRSHHASDQPSSSEAPAPSGSGDIPF